MAQTDLAFGGALVDRFGAAGGRRRTATGRRLARRFSADRRGRFALRLPPGRYTFTAAIYQGAIPLGQEPHATVRVRAGAHPRIRVLEHVL